MVDTIEIITYHIDTELKRNYNKIMPKFQDATRRTTTKLILPSSTKDDEAWVEVYTEAVAGDVEQIANAGESRGLSMLTGIVNIIKDWNFTKEDGSKEEINIDNLRRLNEKDLTYLLTNITAYNALTMAVSQKKS